MELFRITKNQESTLYSYDVAQNKNQAVQLDLLIKNEWHPYILAPFKHKPPHPPARFRPPSGRNVFYSSLMEETALYENAFLIMKLRVPLRKGDHMDLRTLFSVNANDSHAILVPPNTPITDKNDYTASHQFISATAETFIIYPSCRDPKHRNNAAILDINHLAKNPNWESPLRFFYDDNLQQITWLDNGLTISWQEVSK